MGKTQQHYLNPLHVYCRLRDIGLPRDVAIFLGSSYERIIFNRLSSVKRGSRGWQA
jgi:hypothetical protein